jgi:hypothetical protein
MEQEVSSIYNQKTGVVTIEEDKIPKKSSAYGKWMKGKLPLSKRVNSGPMRRNDV